MTMHFRSKSIADSVVERITEISESIRGVAPLPAPRGAATVSLVRQDNGDLMVTKSFENGETELLTVSAPAPPQETPAGLVDVTPPDSEQQPSAGGAGGQEIVQAAALGGDSLDTLLG